MTTDSPPQDTGRRRRRAVERGGGAPAAPAGQPLSPFAPLDLVSRDELEAIHQAALTVLKEIGIDFLHDEARAMLRQAGADADPASRRVRFDPALVEAHIGLAPREFMLHARNPARNLKIGGAHLAFGSVASAPNSFDRAGGRRPGNKRDYQEFPSTGPVLQLDSFLGRLPGRADRHSRVPSAISTLCSTCSRCPTSRSMPTASDASASWTRSRWPKSPAASTTRRSSASPRCSR